jgi:tetratricopeptide (TPR) repeat protein
VRILDAQGKIFSDNLTVDLESALDQKKKATDLFKAGDFIGAVDAFALAIALCPLEENKQIAMVHNNMGICLTKVMKPLPNLKEKHKGGDDAMAKFKMASMGYSAEDICPLRKEAVRHFTKAIELDATYVKPHYQRMQLLKEQQEYEDALVDAKKVHELDPKFSGIGTTIVELERLQKEKFEGMKDEVMGGLKNLGNMFLGNFGMSVDNFKMAQNTDGTYNINYQN